MTAVAATVIVTLLVVVAIARLIELVSDGVCTARDYVAKRQSRDAYLPVGERSVPALSEV